MNHDDTGLHPIVEQLTRLNEALESIDAHLCDLRDNVGLANVLVLLRDGHFDKDHVKSVLQAFTIARKEGLV